MQPVKLLSGLLFILLSATQPDAQAHGSVTADDDLCVINIGYFRAHFKVHLPRTRQHEDFCEDLPDAGEAIFVMEYIHGDLGTVEVDFRIIENVTGLGRFTQLQDVDKIADLESATVFYQPPSVETDVFTALHDFQSTGEFLGIVTARDPKTEQVYSAVFPFEVGYTGVGYLPLFLLLAVITQFGYWLMTGGQWPYPWRRPSPAKQEPSANHESSAKREPRQTGEDSRD